jgi:hypothetical protein
VIRDTIGKLNMVALGRVVLTRREHVIALEPKGRGLMGLTLRYPYEIYCYKEKTNTRRRYITGDVISPAISIPIGRCERAGHCARCRHIYLPLPEVRSRKTRLDRPEPHKGDKRNITRTV